MEFNSNPHYSVKLFQFKFSNLTPRLSKDNALREEEEIQL